MPRLEVTPIRVERTEVPVFVPCVAVADVPPLPLRTRVDPKTADIRQLAAAAAADLLAYEAYGRLADPILHACASAAPPPATDQPPAVKPPPS